MAEYGDVWHYRDGDTHHYSIANPDMIYEILVKQAALFVKGPVYTSEKGGLARFMGRGLVTSNGEFWKRQRRLVAPAFPHPAHYCLCRYHGRLHTRSH